MLTIDRFAVSSRAVPVVFVHGTDSHGGEMRAYVEGQLGDFVFADSLLLFPSFATPYQFLLPAADHALLDAVDALHRSGHCRSEMVLCGFSGGAQFSHRFALKHPARVAGAVCLAAGCWTDPLGASSGMMLEDNWFDRAPWDTHEIQKAISRPASSGFEQVGWTIGCGEADLPSRKSSARAFCASVGASASGFFTWPGAHTMPEGGDATLLFQQIFNHVNRCHSQQAPKLC